MSPSPAHTALPLSSCPRPTSSYLVPPSPSQAARTQRRTSATFRPSPLAGPALSFDSLPLAISSSSISEDGLTDAKLGHTLPRQGPARSASEGASTFERRQQQAGLAHAPALRVSSSSDRDAQPGGSRSSDSESDAADFMPPLPTLRKASSSSLSSHKERDLRRLSLTASLSPSLSSSSLPSSRSVSRSIPTSSRLSNTPIPELSPTSPSNASLSVPDQLSTRRRSTLAAASPSVLKQRSSASLAELAQEELERARRRTSVRFEDGVEPSPKATESGGKPSSLNAPSDRHNWFSAEPIPLFSRSAIKTQGIIMPVAASSTKSLARTRLSTSSSSSSLERPPATPSTCSQKNEMAAATEKRTQHLAAPQSVNEKKVKRRASFGLELKRSISRKFSLSLSSTSPPSVLHAPPESMPPVPVLTYSKAKPSSGSTPLSPSHKEDGDLKADRDLRDDLAHTVEVHVTAASSTSSTSSTSSRSPSVNIVTTASPSSIRRVLKIVRRRSRKRSSTMPQECGEKGVSGVKRRGSASSKKKSTRFPLVRAWA